MSRYLNAKYQRLEPYTPGEQPRDMRYVKLNTNESPYPPAPGVAEAVAEEAGRLQLYCDPTAAALRDALAGLHGLRRENVYVANGSDDILYFAFMAFAGEDAPAFFPDITYGFYRVYCELLGVPYTPIPLKDDFTVDPGDYHNLGGMIAIANPNAPTGLALSRDTIEGILQANPAHVVLVDEAYVDFGAESCVPLIDRYDNLLVVQTFSKSRSMAGARLGFAYAQPGLIDDLNRIKFSTNPYDINRMTQAAGIAAIARNDHCMENCRRVMKTRQDTVARLEALGFEVLPSSANFVFARSDRIGGRALYLALKQRGVLIRHFDSPRISDYNRITIGAPEEMDVLIDQIKQILGA